ncbi:MAG: hypothetical protein N2749_05290 [Clostridia bacterium]|nr:hypothetical protein [Clostridia bacterium]
MEGSCCYTLNIRQLTCQNGITRNFDNLHTSVNANTVIDLSFGYKLTFLNGTGNVATISISNDISLPATVFNIPNGSFRVFDLPCECGTYRVYIGATLAPCGISNLYCSD